MLYNVFGLYRLWNIQENNNFVFLLLLLFINIRTQLLKLYNNNKIPLFFFFFFSSSIVLYIQYIYNIYIFFVITTGTAEREREHAARIAARAYASLVPLRHHSPHTAQHTNSTRLYALLLKKDSHSRSIKAHTVYDDRVHAHGALYWIALLDAARLEDRITIPPSLNHSQFV